jgi:hypothetical protein
LKQNKNKKEDSPEDRFKKVAWSVAADCALDTGEQAVNIYEKLIDKRRGVADESNKTY